MAEVKLTQLKGHAPWQPGEIVTVQVTSAAGDDTYICETLETFPADLKERHAAELAELRRSIEAAPAGKKAKS